MLTDRQPVADWGYSDAIIENEAGLAKPRLPLRTALIAVLVIAALATATFFATRQPAPAPADAHQFQDLTATTAIPPEMDKPGM